MPQDGSNNYQYPPGTPGIPDQTIESEAYNTFLDDLVVNDLNIARPLHRGGTGAVNAHDARFNLSTEVSGAVVTNYDAHVFENGSFHSLPGATGAPAGEEGNYLTGVCSLIDTTGCTIKAFSLNTSLGYLRVKVGSVWGPWEIEGDGRFVNITGDTMTGTLNVSKGVASSIGPIITLQNNSGQLSDAGALEFYDGVIRGRLHFAVDRSPYGADLIYFSGNGAAALQECFRIQTDGITKVTGDLTSNGTIFAPVFKPLDSTGGFNCKDGVSDVTTSEYFNIKYQTGLMHIYVDHTSLGSINVSSDYRIKKDVLDLPGMWDIVKALRPIKYTQAEYTPPAEVERSKEVQAPFVPADNIERWGFIAHELQETLLPSAATGIKDEATAIQSLNLAPVVAALTKALQEAMARIEALEAAG